MVVVALACSSDNIVALQLKRGGRVMLCEFERELDTNEGTLLRVLVADGLALAWDDTGRVHLGHVHAY